MEQKYFSEMLPALANRASLSSISWLGFASTPLRRHLTHIFAQPYGKTGSFLADPAFEAVFGWKACDQSMNELGGTLLSQKLIDAMDAPPPELAEEYRFSKERSPYAHQLSAWKILAQEPPRSLVVTSGTGSGKTECFMVPILDRLVREQARINSQLIGVRALFLYPLNALINSQRDRLQAWTAGFGNQIRYCLYNGTTPDKIPADKKDRNGSEVRDRTTLRASPPPILVTNATMLEYMLVRTQDAAILQASQGKLEWIVLDEAHSYIGSQAAELALLIRRVLHGFGVQADNVRFIATSATIGDPTGEAGACLKKFLADVAGVDASRVYLVAGSRHVPPLPEIKQATSMSVAELWQLDAGAAITPARYRALAADPTAVALRNLFLGSIVHDPNAPTVALLSAVCRTVYPGTDQHTLTQQHGALAWLDLLTATLDDGDTPFLPLRAHLFHQTLSGLWCCADPDCPEKSNTALDDPAWPFGQLFLAPRYRCAEACAAPVYELVACEDCGAIYLNAQVRNNSVMQAIDNAATDEFKLEVDHLDEELLADDDNEDLRSDMGGNRMLIANRKLHKTDTVYISRHSMRFVEANDADALAIVAHEDDGSGVNCPACGATQPRVGQLFRHARISGPFLLGGLLPTMLEFAPDGEHAADRPYNGRRLLTFSDSRQGTARMAAKLQQDAERTKMRGLIYHHVLRKFLSGVGAGIEIDALKTEITELEKVLASPDTSANAKPYLRNQCEDLQRRLTCTVEPVPMSFAELKTAVSCEGGDFKHILQTYSNFSGAVFGSDNGASSLAAMLLVREMGRRPKRQNTLETLGLISVQYPRLALLKTCPPQWVAHRLSLQDWKDFLKIALDYFVRSGGSLSIPPEWRAWIGVRFPPSWVVEPLKKLCAKGERRWPQARNSGNASKLVRLLAHVLKADIAIPAGQDVVDSLLQAAWEDAKSILTLTESGFCLQLEDLAFIPISKAWVCPVTRRLLDTTLCGVTPYLPRIMRSEIAICEDVAVPVYNAPFGDTTASLERIGRARAWLGEQAALPGLRESGLWSDINDRVIELAPYFAAAEHSAQQPAALLDQYEKKFKDGWINLLSCSTTMEMGIDIGGVQTVGMNNVPPHPANYLQRAGRAGRRRETRSTAITLCKSNPHDQNVFLDTCWAFKAKLPPPTVSLNSAVIVQRHVNSMVLAHFLQDLLRDSTQELSKLNCGWFFDDSDTGPAHRFINWCNAYLGKNENRLESGLQQLIKHSLFEGQLVARLVQQSGIAMKDVFARWLAEWRSLLEQERGFGTGSAPDPAAKAIGFQKRRLSDEYLLRELATQGFLPAYGFPTSIASFDNMTVMAAKKLPPQDTPAKPGRDDNRFMKRDLASRDLVTALREYAPGSEIVMDGLVYKSAGITLNWHIPASLADANETQAIKFAWRCSHCGASGTTHSLQMAQQCDSCGKPTGHCQQFLEPAGFAVDFYDDPHNDLSSQAFMPVERPWISARGAWSPLANPRLGRMRATPEGKVYHHSAGLHVTGYALCLACGRAEPMLADKTLPKSFEEGKSHTKLRSRKDDRVCSGSSNRFAIKSGIVLGHQRRTDVLEIQLKDENGAWVIDKVEARTMAVALRDALAELLGVQARELGCDVQEMHNDEGTLCQSLFIFDHFAAGYTSCAQDKMTDMFRMAINRLACKNQCDSCCPQCVLDFDLRFDAANLNRHAALRVMTPNWLAMMKLPDDMCYLGPNSQVETMVLMQAILRESGKNDATLTRLYAIGANGTSDIASSPLRHLAYRLAALSRPVEIAIEQELLDALPTAERYALASLADHPCITLVRLARHTVKCNAIVIACVYRADGNLAWATNDALAIIANVAWGTSAQPFVCGNVAMLPAAHRHFTAAEIRPAKESGDLEIVLHHELDGQLNGFGKRFWDAITKQHGDAAQLLSDAQAAVVGVQYQDRYLFTPVSVALLIELVTGLRDWVGPPRWDNPATQVCTTGRRDGSPNRVFTKVYSDWPDTQVRDNVMKAAFADVGLNCQLAIEEKFDLSHGRALTISMSNGAKLIIRLDQGVSYWRVAPQSAQGGKNKSARFDFGAQLLQQAAMVASMAISVEGGALPTELFVKKR